MSFNDSFDSTGNVIFIGAGASYGARISQKMLPPLGHGLLSWLREFVPVLQKETCLIDFRSELEEGRKIINRNLQDENFEVLMSGLTREDRLKLNRLLLIAFSDIGSRTYIRSCSNLDLGFRNQADGYDKLITKLNFKNEKWSVVSLNYDLLFEQALIRNDIGFFYPHFRFRFKEDQTQLSGIKIYKPHGSINFFAHSDHKIYHHEPLPTDDRGLPTTYFHDQAGNMNPTLPIVMACPNGVENILSIANSASISDPVIANYSKGKTSDLNQETLEMVRRESLQILTAAKNVVMVGVRPIRDEGDDYFVAKALESIRGKLKYVAGNIDDCRVIEQMYCNAELFSKGLNDFLERI